MDMVFRSIMSQAPLGALVIAGVAIIYVRVSDLVKEVKCVKEKLEQHIVWHLNQTMKGGK